VLVREGVADNTNMIRIDIFEKDNKFYCVPVYASDYGKKKLPNRAVKIRTKESDWRLMDESSTFRFSLYTNEWIEITFKDDSQVKGYFSQFDRTREVSD